MEMRALNLEFYECTVPASGLNVEEVGKKKEVGRCGFPDGEILEEEYQKEKERSGKY